MFRRCRLHNRAESRLPKIAHFAQNMHIRPGRIIIQREEYPVIPWDRKSGVLLLPMRPLFATSDPPPIGISAVALHQPGWSLDNEWFTGTIPRKFVHHTGIHSRLISEEDEVTMAVRAAENLQHETGCDFENCAGLVFASPSFIPRSVARHYLHGQRLKRENLRRAAKMFARRMLLPDCPLFAINWFCSGYSKALEIVQRRMLPSINLRQDQFVLVVNTNRISRITDFGCQQTSALFGDLATATMLARDDSARYPTHFSLVHARAIKRPADGAYFQFHVRENVPLPQKDGTRRLSGKRLVFSLDGMGVADTAPRAMADEINTALTTANIPADQVQFVVPHQAGAGIVRLATMKIEALGIRGEVVNGLTAEIGNVSSCSIPYALRSQWDRLEGLIACPTAAVGRPGIAEMSQGCILLQSTPHHSRQKGQNVPAVISNATATHLATE